MRLGKPGGGRTAQDGPSGAAEEAEPHSEECDTGGVSSGIKFSFKIFMA